ncbi:MAG: hypothetical protein OXH79_19215 [Boseongicola sp.]|nr:hypothetical protein [Boseongicola sp.]
MAEVGRLAALEEALERHVEPLQDGALARGRGGAMVEQGGWRTSWRRRCRISIWTGSDELVSPGLGQTRKPTQDKDNPFAVFLGFR